MRIALIYPPPWKIAAASESPDPVHGPPPGYRAGDLDPDFWQVPYGLLSLGAQALRAGHQVKVVNLSAFEWSRVERVIEGLDAELFGISCWTANRRGVALVAKLIKEKRQAAHVLVGGPHATPLAKEMLEHHEHIDTISLGESEEQLMELISRLESGASVRGIAGTVYRDELGVVTRGPERAAIHELDSLASPHDYFSTHIVMTSRGCPWACTFCGAETTWGRGFRGQSVAYVLDALEAALERIPVRMIQIKDDTFTTNKKRVIELCRGIRERKLDFLWSCDTRVDVLSDELLYEMRLAGCQRMSLGVESGSAKILKAIDKKITVDKILESSALAKKYGIQLRFYMMLGNRGETEESFMETLAFLKAAKPHQYIFSCLSIYPGTRDFYEAEKQGRVNREMFFTENFQELKTPFDASEDDAKLMNEWFEKNCGMRDFYREGVDECLAIVERLGDYHAAHMDLGGAYYREAQMDLAEQHVKKALELGYPLPGLAYNYLACIAANRRNLDALQENLKRALREDPQHFVVAQNAEAVRTWFSQGGPVQNLPLNLAARHEFQVFERTKQPALPGDLPDDFEIWAAPLAASGGQPSVGGDNDSAQPRTRLKVVSSP